MVENFRDLPESPKDKLKIKLKLGQTIAALAYIPAFNQELQGLALELIKMEVLSTKFKDFALHDSIIDIIDSLYLSQ